MIITTLAMGAGVLVLKKSTILLMRENYTKFGVNGS